MLGLKRKGDKQMFHFAVLIMKSTALPLMVDSNYKNQNSMLKCLSAFTSDTINFTLF